MNRTTTRIVDAVIIGTFTGAIGFLLVVWFAPRFFPGAFIKETGPNVPFLVVPAALAFIAGFVWTLRASK